MIFILSLFLLSWWNAWTIGYCFLFLLIGVFIKKAHDKGTGEQTLSWYRKRYTFCFGKNHLTWDIYSLSMSYIDVRNTFRNWPELDTCGQSNLFHVIAHVISEKSARGSCNPFHLSATDVNIRLYGEGRVTATCLCQVLGDRLVE